jgi:pimeloyl-ACP methyl ester carboxylesterase
VALIARLNVTTVDWIGTSMGGLIGMAMAAYPDSPINRLVLNDIGAFISQDALQRIGDYVGLDERFDSIEALETNLRQRYQAFKGLSDRQWKHIAEYGHRKTEQGNLALHYDPIIGEYAKQAAGQDIDLWPLWKKINCPQLLLWGEQSDVLRQDTVNRMQQLNPELELMSYPGIGHAPSLMEAAQIQSVINWLT